MKLTLVIVGKYYCYGLRTRFSVVLLLACIVSGNEIIRGYQRGFRSTPWTAHQIVRVATAASVNVAVCWVAAHCSPTEVSRRFRGACCSSIRAISDGKLVPDYTTQHPRRVIFRHSKFVRYWRSFVAFHFIATMTVVRLMKCVLIKPIVRSE
jgi:hypothetical protein